MQFRKITAVAGSALLAGATLATAVMGATVNTVGEITSKMGKADDFPLFVVGASASAEDVAGAIDIAVRLAANSKTTEPVSVETAETSVTGGYLLETDVTKLHFKDTIDTAISVLTSNELPELLAPGTVTVDGTNYDYDQYIRVGSKQIVYNQPTSTEKDPTFFIQLGTNPTVGSSYLVQAEVVFDNTLNISEAKGEEIKLFGKTYTIAPESDTTKIVLYGSADEVTVNAGETATLKVGDNEYTAEVVGIVDEDTAVLKVNGVTKEVNEGNSYDFGGVSVYVKDVFYYKVPTETGSVVISAGSEKIVLKNNDAVRMGEDEETVKGTKVSLTYSNYGLDQIKIAFDAQDSTSNYIKAGETWTDPVFGTIKVAFNGLDSTSTEEITVEAASTSTYQLTFTDSGGNSASIEFAYGGSDTSDGNLYLQDSNGYDYVVIEGQGLELYDYTILAAQTGFEKLVQVSSIDVDDSNNKAVVTLKDVITGTEYEATLTEQDDDDNLYNGTKVISGQTYYIGFDDADGSGSYTSGDKVYITWGTGARINIASDTLTPVMGSYITIYPALPTSKGAKIALTAKLTPNMQFSASQQFVFPTTAATGCIYNASANFDKNYTVCNGVNYTMTFNAAGTQLTNIQINGVNYPAVVVLEEADAGSNRNAVIVPVKEDTSSGVNRLDIDDAGLDMTDSNAVEDEPTSDTYTEKFVDTYGVLMTQSGTDGQDKITIVYPDNQLIAKVAVGTNPQFGTATSEVTRDVVVPVTSDVAVLDTEVTDTMKQNYDLIVVGGPCVNMIAAELMGVAPGTCGAESGIPENAAIVKVFPDFYASGRTAVLVAGWEAENTKKACTMLQSGDLDAYDVQAVKISDSTVEELTVEEAAAEETTEEASE